jgi:hypothetical protein
MSDCNICCNTFTKCTRKPVECLICKKISCIECVKRYILSTTGEPHCLHCKVAYNAEFVSDTFTMSFLNGDYKFYRRNLLFDIEKAKIPDSLPHLDAFKELKTSKEFIKKIIKDYVDSGNTLNNLNSDYSKALEIYTECVLKGYKNTLQITQSTQNTPQINTLNLSIIQKTNYKSQRDKCVIDYNIYSSFAYKNYISQLKAFLDGNLGTLPVFHHKPSKKEYVTKILTMCPKNDCRGFIGTSLKCVLCSIKICTHCHIELLEDTTHECNQDTVKTVQLLKQDSKPCPKCSSLIHRISGCNQMWCIVCHVAFDWTTGKMSTQRVHNPEYFRYLNEHGGGEQLQLDCNIRFLDTPNGERILYSRDLNNMDKIEFLRNVYQTLTDVAHRILPMSYFTIKGNTLDPYILPRLQYMNNEISKEKFMQVLTTMENKINKALNMNQILNMYIDVTDDFIKLCLQSKKVSNLDLVNFEKIRSYTNECFKNKKEKRVLFIPKYSSTARIRNSRAENRAYFVTKGGVKE